MSKVIRGITPKNKQIIIEFDTAEPKNASPPSSWAPPFANIWRTTSDCSSDSIDCFSKQFRQNAQFKYASNPANNQFNNPGYLMVGSNSLNIKA